jgi:hypothetical protein
VAFDASPGSTLGWPGRIAVAVLRSDPPQVFLAKSDAVLGRVVALRLVARSSTQQVEQSGLLEHIRRALLEERWGDAVELWMRATGQVLDAYPDEEVATEERLDEAYASVEIRLSPIFEDTPELDGDSPA